MNSAVNVLVESRNVPNTGFWFGILILVYIGHVELAKQMISDTVARKSS